MSAPEGHQPELPLPRGSLDYVSISARFDRISGWELQLWHGHPLQIGVCDRKDKYEGLSTREMVQIVYDLMAAVNVNWVLDKGVCVPQEATPSSSVPLNQ